MALSNSKDVSEYPPHYHAAVSFFKEIPWLTELITSPTSILTSPHTRHPSVPATSMTQDLLFSQTLTRGPSPAIHHILRVFKDPRVPDAPALPRAKTPESSTGLRMPVDNAMLLFHLGDGAKGFNGFVQGGLIAGLFDEAMGNLISSGYDVFWGAFTEENAWPADVLDIRDKKIVTASMSVEMKKPIVTPATVAISASFSRVEPKKVFLDLTLHDDKHTYATGKGLWIVIDKSRYKI